MIEVAAVGERLGTLRARVARRGADGVRIVAVTKGFGADAVRAAMAVGLEDIGESYAQECIEKLGHVDPRPSVHFIGGLQRNKVRRLAGVVDLWQSIDRAALVDEVARHDPGARVLVQVDLSGEHGKRGCPPGEAAALVGHATAAGLDVAGLMGVGPLGPAGDARSGFRELRRLVDSLGLRECSMGMSDDIDVALDEGSTMIRVGTALSDPARSGQPS
ncbi:MAG: YggS family pyridoxal phosphate enzyme [Acidimicrobiales bacterium]